MADPKEGESFFRKVVRFVANPATDWNEISAARPDDGLDLERSELKAMIERKRRNDFVRKREFDTLRRLRREGLSPEQLAALGGSSKVDDSEVRLTESSGARAEIGVKAKIDEIEQQMVGNGGSGLPAASPVRRPPADPRPPRPTPNGRPTDFYSATTQPVPRASAAAPAQPQPPLGGTGWVVCCPGSSLRTRRPALPRRRAPTAVMAATASVRRPAALTPVPTSSCRRCRRCRTPTPRPCRCCRPGR